MDEYYEAKKLKYSLLFAENKPAFDKKLQKKKQDLDFWNANYKLWSYRGCMTRDVLPKDCNEAACQRRVESMMSRYGGKVYTMEMAAKEASSLDS